MNFEDAPLDSYHLADRCVVLWLDGSLYTGRVEKILDPVQEIVLQDSTFRKGSKAGKDTSQSLEAFQKNKAQRIPKKVVDECVESGQNWYYVHYFGWKTNYDEWLPRERMLPYTPSNISTMKSLNAERKENEQKQKEEQHTGKQQHRRRTEPPAVQSPALPPPSSARTSSQPSTAGSATNSKRSASASAEDRPKRRRTVALDDGPAYEIKLPVPLELKRELVKDWQLVTRDRQIVQLPRPVCVVEILKDFVNAQSQGEVQGARENLQQFKESILTYFDYALGMMLLYRFERNQYYQQRHLEPNFKPSLVYGAEHLARLIVSMPGHLSHASSMDDITMKYVVEKAAELASFMSEHRVRYFGGEPSYDSPTRVYEVLSVPNMAESHSSKEEKKAEDP